MAEENVFVGKSGLPYGPAISYAVVFWGLRIFFWVEKICFSPFQANHTSGQDTKGGGENSEPQDFPRVASQYITRNHLRNVSPPSSESSVLWINSRKRVRTCRPTGNDAPNQPLLTHASCSVYLSLCQSVNFGLSWPWHLALDVLCSDWSVPSVLPIKSSPM